MLKKLLLDGVMEIKRYVANKEGYEEKLKQSFSAENNY